MGWNPIYINPWSSYLLESPGSGTNRSRHPGSDRGCHSGGELPRCVWLDMIDHICLPNGLKEFTPASDLPTIEGVADPALEFQNLNRN